MRRASSALVPLWDTLPVYRWIDKVHLLTYLLSIQPQVEAPVTHLFENGNYIREQRLGKNTLLTGREHLRGHEMQLLEGRVLLIAPDGRFEFEPPASVTTHSGFHAIAIALEDSLVRTVHPNPDNLTDTDALEALWFGSSDAMVTRGRALAEALSAFKELA